MYWYVYHLVDPRTNAVFYVGKGCADRVDHHEREAGGESAHPKCEVIRSIWSDGLEVGKVIAKRFSDEVAAYAYEASEIERIGFETLTNLVAGGGYPRKHVEREQESMPIDLAKRVLSMVAKILHMKARNLQHSSPWQEFVDKTMPRL